MAKPLPIGRLVFFLNNAPNAILMWLGCLMVYVGMLSFPPATRLTLLSNLGVKDVFDFRVITGTFMHAEFDQLFANTTILLLLGVWLENKLGRLKFIASVASCMITTWGFYVLRSPTKVAVGASGVVFGLFGMFLCSQHKYAFIVLVPVALIWLAKCCAAPVPGSQDIHAMGFLVGSLISAIERNYRSFNGLQYCG